MTREQAIQELAEWIKQMKDHGVPNYSTRYKALGMALQALQGKSINCNYTCSDCVHQNKAYEEEPCHSCFNNDGAGYEPVGYEPVKHGKWIVDEKHTEEIYTHPVICSVCGKDVTTEYGEYTPYCPNCGAKMRGEEE